MKRFTANGPFDLWKDKEKCYFEGTQNITLRAEEMARIYSSATKTFKNEVLVAMGEGEFDLKVRANRYYRFQSEGRVWLGIEIRDQTVEQSEETFTTLDRPSALSPEMRAIHELTKRNELERELDRQKMERSFNERMQLLANQSGTAPHTPAASKEIRGNAEPGAPDPSEPEDTNPDQAASTSEDTEPQPVKG